MRKVLHGLLLAAALASHGAQAADYTVDHARSEIAFSGTHADEPFTGRFEQWQARIVFDPAHLAASTIEVEIDTASAKTGNAMYDGTLPTSDWFNAKEQPKATFVSQAITQNEGGSYTARGTLTLRGVAQPLSIVFALTPADLSTPEVSTAFTLTIDRLAFGLGAKSDGKAEWVGRDIRLNVKLTAARA